MLKQNATRREKVLKEIYSSSWHTSMIALSIVCALEIFMLVYTLINPTLYGEFLNTYRVFYFTLLAASVAYIVLNLCVKRDMEHRYVWLNYANPLYATFFYGWSLGITYFDAAKYAIVDPIVFMTFSLMVPLSFYLFATVYSVIVLTVDALMLYLTVTVSGSLGPMINLSIFFVFQIVLGVSFLRVKRILAERIVQEQENSEIDVLTGFPNRRAYETDVLELAKNPLQADLVYVAIDMNELKEVNDSRGHDAGDRLIMGATQCMQQCFGDRGKIYRIGGDEFVALIHVPGDEVDGLMERYEQRMKAWSGRNGLVLSTANGFVRCADYPGSDITEIARLADTRMYQAKARYYQSSGRDRRKYTQSA